MLIGYVTQVCCNSQCGIAFAVPSSWDAQKRKDHTNFYCPNGHSQHYTEQSEEEKLRAERDRLAQRIAQRDDEIRHQRELRAAAERQLSATRGVVTRVKTRVANGVCPCCKRSFSDLRQHMATKHAGYAGHDEARTA